MKRDEAKWYMCDSKRQYSEHDIKQKAKAVKKRGVSIRYYECPHCGLYHLTKGRE